MMRILLLISTLAASAYAGPVLGVVSSSVELSFPATPPSSLATNQTQSDTTVFGYLEKYHYALAQSVPVDIVTNGAATYNSPLNLLSPGNLPVGTWIASYYLHFDPVGLNKTRSVTMEFEPWMIIRGIQVLPLRLNNSSTNSELKLPGVVYETNNILLYGLELGLDSIQLADSHTITVNFRNSLLVDDVRILVQTPEPSYALLLAPAIGLLLWQRRRVVATAPNRR